MGKSPVDAMYLQAPSNRVAETAAEPKPETKAEAVARGRQDLAEGRLVDLDQVSAWLKSWGSDDELALPDPVVRC